MSKLGRMPIALPKGVKITVANGMILVEGPKGKLTRPLMAGIKLEVAADKVKVTRDNEQKQTKSFHGMTRSLLGAMVKGVSDGFSRTIVAVGVGYRMAVQGTKLTVNAGYSHPVIYDFPKGVTAKVDDQTKLTISGPDKEQLGLIADQIRFIRSPEPYKGKGLRYEGEVIQLKEGKSGAAGKAS